MIKRLFRSSWIDLYLVLITTFLALVFILILSCSLVSGENKKPDGELPPSGMTGNWQGKGKIIVSWCEQDSLSFYLTITSDGKVSGKIGDAVIKNGQLKKNSLILRWLGNSEYIIEADLEGSIVKTENITRESIKLIVDFEDNCIVGDFRTSGGKFGGKDKMQMAGGLKVISVK